MTTGQRMKSRRKELGLSAEYVAGKLKLSPATIYRYENGGIDKVPGDILEPLAQVLRTTPACLMGWEAPTDHAEPNLVLETATNEDEQAFLDSHFGVVYGDPGRLQLGASILAQTPDDQDNAAAILMALTALCRDNCAVKIQNLKELTEMISQLPDAKCEAIMDFARFVAKSQQDN